MAKNPAPSQGGEPAAAAAATPAVTRSEVSDFILRLTAKHGTVENALNQLATDQLKYRRRAQSAEAERDAAVAKVPKDGSVILTGDEAKHFEALKKVPGLDLAKVPDQLKELGTLKTKDLTTSREAALTKAAGEGEDARYNRKLLGKLIPADAAIEFKTVKVKGKDKDGNPTIEEEEVPYLSLKKADGTATSEPLATYLEREHEEFMDILVVDGEESSTTERQTSTTRESAPATGARTPTQRPTPRSTSSKDKEKDTVKVVDRAMSSKYLTPGQLRKEAAGTTP